MNVCSFGSAAAIYGAMGELSPGFEAALPVAIPVWFKGFPAAYLLHEAKSHARHKSFPAACTDRKSVV